MDVRVQLGYNQRRWHTCAVQGMSQTVWSVDRKWESRFGDENRVTSGGGGGGEQGEDFPFTPNDAPAVAEG